MGGMNRTTKTSMMHPYLRCDFLLLNRWWENDMYSDRTKARMNKLDLKLASNERNTSKITKQ